MLCVQRAIIKNSKLRSFALFNKCRLTSSSGKETGEIDNAHIICSLYESKSGSRDSSNLSIEFQRSIDARERELTKYKTTKGNYHVRI